MGMERRPLAIRSPFLLEIAEAAVSKNSRRSPANEKEMMPVAFGLEKKAGRSKAHVFICATLTHNRPSRFQICRLNFSISPYEFDRGLETLRQSPY
jgi:hypothetical protein